MYYYYFFSLNNLFFSPDQLDVLLHHVEFDEEAYPLDRQTVEKIRNLQTQAEDISDKAIPYVDNTDPQYYKRKYSRGHYMVTQFSSKASSPEKSSLFIFRLIIVKHSQFFSQKSGAFAVQKLRTFFPANISVYLIYIYIFFLLE